jgi:hypothetical protein
MAPGHGRLELRQPVLPGRAQPCVPNVYRLPAPRASMQVRSLKADEPVCTPGSVPAQGYPRAGDGHPSRPCVAAGLERSTRLCLSEESRAGSPQTQSV